MIRYGRVCIARPVFFIPAAFLSAALRCGDRRRIDGLVDRIDLRGRAGREARQFRWNAARHALAA